MRESLAALGATSQVLDLVASALSFRASTQNVYSAHGDRWLVGVRISLYSLFTLLAYLLAHLLIDLHLYALSFSVHWICTMTRQMACFSFSGVPL